MIELMKKSIHKQHQPTIGLIYVQVDFLASWLFDKLTFWQVDFLVADFVEVDHFS